MYVIGVTYLKQREKPNSSSLIQIKQKPKVKENAAEIMFKVKL